MEDRDSPRQDLSPRSPLHTLNRVYELLKSLGTSKSPEQEAGGNRNILEKTPGASSSTQKAATSSNEKPADDPLLDDITQLLWRTNFADASPAARERRRGSVGATGVKRADTTAASRRSSAASFDSEAILLPAHHRNQRVANIPTSGEEDDSSIPDSVPREKSFYEELQEAVAKERERTRRESGPQQNKNRDSGDDSAHGDDDDSDVPTAKREKTAAEKLDAVLPAKYELEWMANRMKACCDMVENELRRKVLHGWKLKHYDLPNVATSIEKAKRQVENVEDLAEKKLKEKAELGKGLQERRKMLRATKNWMAYSNITETFVERSDEEILVDLVDKEKEDYLLRRRLEHASVDAVKLAQVAQKERKFLKRVETFTHGCAFLKYFVDMAIRVRLAFAFGLLKAHPGFRLPQKVDDDRALKTVHEEKSIEIDHEKTLRVDFDKPKDVTSEARFVSTFTPEASYFWSTARTNLTMIEPRKRAQSPTVVGIKTMRRGTARASCVLLKAILRRHICDRLAAAFHRIRVSFYEPLSLGGRHSQFGYSSKQRHRRENGKGGEDGIVQTDDHREKEPTIFTSSSSSHQAPTLQQIQAKQPPQTAVSRPRSQVSRSGFERALRQFDGQSNAVPSTRNNAKPSVPTLPLNDMPLNSMMVDTHQHGLDPALLSPQGSHVQQSSLQLQHHEQTDRHQAHVTTSEAGTGSNFESHQERQYNAKSDVAASSSVTHGLHIVGSETPFVDQIDRDSEQYDYTIDDYTSSIYSGKPYEPQQQSQSYERPKGASREPVEIPASRPREVEKESTPARVEEPGETATQGVINDAAARKYMVQEEDLSSKYLPKMYRENDKYDPALFKHLQPARSVSPAITSVSRAVHPNLHLAPPQLSARDRDRDRNEASSSRWSTPTRFESPRKYFEKRAHQIHQEHMTDTHDTRAFLEANRSRINAMNNVGRNVGAARSVPGGRDGMLVTSFTPTHQNVIKRRSLEDRLQARQQVHKDEVPVFDTASIVNSDTKILPDRTDRSLQQQSEKLHEPSSSSSGLSSRKIQIVPFASTNVL